MAGGSQGTPDIIPGYLLRRIEAARRYPRLERYGRDSNAGKRQAFLEGAEWEAEHGRDTGNPG